ncbi:hypothetical protein [Luteibacter sp. SG786]|uniref:hypothetical protein n=1 Tax=Luteibacter sp. SG786 TaxID=2587130 RepID=UPI001FFE16EE|nr:hypothetical protein [Luteibacter sp. SG786]
MTDGSDPVAVREAASAGAGQGATGESTVHLVGEVVEVHLGHEAAQTHVGLVRFPLRVDAITYPDEADAGELQPADGHRELGTITAEARKIVHEQHLEAVRVGEEALISLAVKA